MSVRVTDEPRMVYTTSPDGYLEPRIDPNCPYASVAPTTIIDRFALTVERFGNRPAIALKRPQKGECVDNVDALPWKFWTWKEYHQECTKFAKTLLHLRCEPFTVVNCIGFNSPEWFMANNGALLAACITAGIYTTSTPEACQYISQHSKAQVAVVEGNAQLAKYSKIASTLPHLKCIVVWGNDEIDLTLAGRCGVVVYGWSAFLALGVEAGVSDAALESRQRIVRPGNCSTLIYTSGTTGPPKAVMCSHDNITWTTSTLTDNYLQLHCEDRVLSYLPLSHIAAQIMDVHVPMLVGGCTYFAQPDCMKGSLVTSIRAAQPTMFFGVPRVWEKIQEKLAALGRESTGLKRIISTWAKSLALDKAQRAQYGGPGGSKACFGCVSSIVLSKIKEALGLGSCRHCFVSAAPISQDTLWYFASLGIPIYEVYGQSECTGPQTVCVEGAWRIGSCGRPMAGTESKFGSDGEYMYRGRHVMMGYMHMEAETQAAIDAEGYLHSGDVSAFDADGGDPRVRSGPNSFMKITGRKKELLITAGGENIPPVLIETEMKLAMLALSNVMVIGDRRKYLTMLVSLKTVPDAATGAPSDQLASDALYEGRRIGSSATTAQQAAVDPLWRAYVDAGMKEANSKAISSAQKVQRWAWLPRDFSEAEGTLTPTLKLKRKVATEMHAKLIETLYTQDAGGKDD